MLTLPDGRALNRDDVFAAIDDYCKRWPAVFALYDLSNPGPHDEVLPVDVLAPNALNAWGKGQPMTAMTAAWLAKDRIERAVRPISKTPLEELDDSALAIEARSVGSALDVIDEIKGYGNTATSKFFHRFRWANPPSNSQRRHACQSIKLPPPHARPTNRERSHRARQRHRHAGLGASGDDPDSSDPNADD